MSPRRIRRANVEKKEGSMARSPVDNLPVELPSEVSRNTVPRNIEQQVYASLYHEFLCLEVIDRPQVGIHKHGDTLLAAPPTKTVDKQRSQWPHPSAH